MGGVLSVAEVDAFIQTIKKRLLVHSLKVWVTRQNKHFFFAVVVISYNKSMLPYFHFKTAILYNDAMKTFIIYRKAKAKYVKKYINVN